MTATQNYSLLLDEEIALNYMMNKSCNKRQLVEVSFSQNNNYENEIQINKARNENSKNKKHKIKESFFQNQNYKKRNCRI